MYFCSKTALWLAKPGSSYGGRTCNHSAGVLLSSDPTQRLDHFTVLEFWSPVLMVPGIGVLHCLYREAWRVL